MGDTPACPAHRALVDAAMGEAPDDAVLERYAAEVPACPDCRRALSVELSVHPAVLERGGSDARDLRGMRDLWQALQRPVAPAHVRWIQGAAVLAIAAAAAWMLWPAVQPQEPAVPSPPSEVVAAPVLAPPVAPPPAPEPAPAPVVIAPQRQTPPTPPVVEAPSSDDAVADAGDDWPAPAFEELRDGTAKALGGLRSVQLVLSAPGPRTVGDTVGLTVVASEETALAVCVDGPERGVVWRGGVPAGRIALTRARRQQSFAFGAPGTYRFALSTSDLDACSDPVHVVEVEVGR